MIYEAKVEAQCDECQDEFAEVELDYVYRDYSGNSGHYDDSNVETELKELGWKVADEKHFCPSCK